MQKTKIDWCDSVCNAVDGCTFGCEFCYARKMNDRFHFVKDFSKPEFFPDRLKALYSKKPQVVFMDSMSDIADWKPEWAEHIYYACEDNPQHKYLFLTKRSRQVCEYFMNHEYFYRNKNWYIGATVTKQIENCRIGQLPGLFKNFASIEPIMGPMIISAEYLCWLIIGAETGNRKGKVIPEKKWIDDIVANCRQYNVPIFMKESLRPLMGADFIQEYPWSAQDSGREQV